MPEELVFPTSERRRRRSPRWRSRSRSPCARSTARSSQAGEHVVIFGAGPIGQAICLLARERDAPVLMIDPVASRLEIGARHGRRDDALERRRDRSSRASGRAARAPRSCSTRPARPTRSGPAFEAAVSAGRAGDGRHVRTTTCRCACSAFVDKELDVLGVSCAKDAEFEDAVAFVERNGDKLENLISQEFPLERAPEALRWAMDHPAEAMKVVIGDDQLRRRSVCGRAPDARDQRQGTRRRSTRSATRSCPARTGCRRPPSSACPRRCSWPSARSPQRGRAGRSSPACWTPGTPRTSRSLSQAEREARAAGLGATRPRSVSAAAFQALRKGILLELLLPARTGEGPNPVDEALGYPGPLGPAREPAAQDDRAARRSRADTELDCDVVVVGSGAGGGTAAGVLAAAGLDVVVRRGGRVLQRGGLRRRRAVRVRAAVPERRRGGHRRPEHRAAGGLVPRRRDGRQLHLVLPAARLRARGLEAALRAVRLGRPGLRRQPRRGLGADLDQLREQHPVRARPRDARAGWTKLGWHSEVMQRNCKGCKEEVCRLCHYGCQIGAKQSTMKTWLQDAYDNGARILVNTPGGSGADRGRAGPGRRGRDARRAQGDGARRAPWRWPPARSTRRRSCCARGWAAQRRQEPDAAPGADHLGDVRRGGAALGGHDRRDLLGRVPRHGRGLRHQVRARRDAAEHPGDLRPLARRRASRPS